MCEKRTWVVKNPNKPAKSCPRKGLTKDQMLEWGIKVLTTNDAYGYKVQQYHKERPIFVHKTSQYKYGGCKYAPYVIFNIRVNDKCKQKMISLAAIVYCWYIHDIPDGYVVDHINNDSFTNCLSNLQLLTIGDNVRKNSVGHNQYTNPDELVHKVEALRPLPGITIQDYINKGEQEK